MNWSVPIFKLFGIRVRLHYTFLILLAFIALPILSANPHAKQMALFLFLETLGIFLIIILHEFGHSLVAIRLGAKVKDIILLPFAGFSRIENMPEKPIPEIIIALAGPAVNFLLFAIIWGIVGDFSEFTKIISDLFSATEMKLPELNLMNFLIFLGAFNLFVAVFNILPVFPMDGGRALRGFLSLFMTTANATIVAVEIGRFFSFLFTIYAIVLIIQYNLIFTGIIVLVIAFFLTTSAKAEARSVLVKSLLKNVKLEKNMLLQPSTVLHRNMTLRDAESLIFTSEQSFFPVLDNGYLVSVFTRGDYFEALQLYGSNVSLPIKSPVWVMLGADIVKLVAALDKKKKHSVAVTDWYGRFLGIFSRQTVNNIINKKIAEKGKLSFFEQKYLRGR